ncbi:uncharacterized protein spa17 isoform X2 [Anguilla rostrata]|uniref:uncharacterized protein spa17 isoform X2 n=1 Tax=Anguilla rostrata TaxID=7938 RepID=UPI0030D06F46
MSIPFSNTTLRVPRGFGNLLEGLAREVLRNQPKDIPTFAALYFSALLKEREESGLDPAEWGAKLEDRFYNNHAFKETEKEADGSSEPQREAVETVPENSAADTPGYVEQEVIQPVHISTVSSANFDVLDDVPGVESWGEGGTGGRASEDICAAELAPSPVAPYGGVADVDICAEGLRVPGGLGEFDLTTVVGTPTPLPTPLPVPEEIPTAGSPGSVLLDFRDDEAGQMQDAIPGNAVEETPPRTDAAEQVRGEVPETPEAVLEHGEGQEENEEAAEIDDATKSDLHLKGGNKSGTELQTGEEDPPLGRASPGEEDPPLGRASPGEEDPPLGRASPGEEDPPLGRTSPGEEDPPLGRTSPGEEDPPLERALGSAREEGSTEEHNDPESFQPQKTCTEEAEATNRDTPPQNSAGMTNTSDDKADDHEDNSKEEAKIDASVADAESDEFSVGDVQAESKENVSISAEQQVAKESEPGRDVGSVGKEQGIESEEQRQGIESEEQDQGIESEEQEQGKDSEEQRQGKESEEQEQGKESEEQRQGKESEEQEQGKESEEQEQGRESEEQGQVKNSEDLNQGAESEEQNQGEVLKEQAQNSESEEQTQGEVLEEQAQDSESEEQTQGEVLEEQAQDAELEEQTQGAELEEQVPAVIPEVNMDEREPKEEREDLLQNMDKRNHSDEQESAQQEEEKVPVGEEGDHKEECSQPQEEEDVMDIPLDDPEANKAAAKIQAGFRGHMTRKKMKDDKPREEVSSSPDALSGSQRDSEPAGSEGLARDDSSASEQ